MDEPISLDKDRYELVKTIVAAMYQRLVETVITDIKSLPDNCRQSGDDSKLKDVWEEFKYEIQREQSILFFAYEDTIQRICARQVAELDRERQQLLWLWSDGYYDWNDEDDKIPWGEMVTDALAKELYDRVCSVANNEELAIDPDEERDRERHEEDMRLDRLQSEPDKDDSTEGDSMSGPDE